MNHEHPKEQPAQFGGFSSAENQLKNTLSRGMEPDATVEEVIAFDRLERDAVNVEHYGYSLGTTSAEIAEDLNKKRR